MVKLCQSSRQPTGWLSSARTAVIVETLDALGYRYAWQRYYDPLRALLRRSGPAWSTRSGSASVLSVDGDAVNGAQSLEETLLFSVKVD